ncbi:GNAT family N-acetyltransferase [Brevibacterium sp. CBA3109]|uniref:GNAT family N-acetyltransferase n=1 Tax=Brevibacterium koreense TaxID=3140787 RepID=A0AAU7UPJ6_9MICO
MSFDIVPATSDLWPRVGHVYGAREKNPDSCWCQRFRRHDAPDNRTALRREIEQTEVPVGLLALADGEVAGWTRVVPRASLPAIVENRALSKLLDDAALAWWVSCFVVRREHRGKGVGVALLRGGAEWAFQHGAYSVDGHPVDVDALRGSPAPSAVFTGTMSMFLRAGFSEIGRTYPSRPVMRRLRFSDSTVAEPDS